MKRTAAALITVAMTGGATALAVSDDQAPKPPKRPNVRTATCTYSPPTPTVSTNAPSRPLLDALGILERPAEPGDRPPDAVVERAAPMDGLMLDSARRLGDGTWLLPVENVVRFQPLPARCAKRLPAAERRAVRKVEADTRRRGPVEGVAFVSGEPPMAAPSWPLEAIQDGRAFTENGCAGPMHDKIGIRGLVPDGVTKVTVTAQDGTITEAMAADNTFALELPRPDRPEGLPAHLTYATATGPKDVELTRNDGFAKPCEPPTKAANGQRREPPTPLKSPRGARIELQTSRWQAEDSGPLVVGATYRTSSGRCLIVGPEKRLPKGYRMCIKDSDLKAQRYIAKAARLPNGDVIMGGFADRDQVTYVLMERSSVVGGARVLWPAKRSGAFFVTRKGPHRSGGSFQVRIALRGKPLRYANTRTIELDRQD